MRSLLCFLVLALSGCGGLLSPTKKPKSAEDVISMAERGAHVIATARNLDCARKHEPSTPERIACTEKVRDDAVIAEEILGVVKEWLPELEDAVRNRDELRENTAREHLAAALEKTPDAYADITKLAEGLPFLHE